MDHTYETIFICPAELVQEKIEATLEKVKSIINKANGKISAAELWGRRKLAYPIRRNRDGFYIYVAFTSPPGTISQLDHHYRVTDTILRGLTVKVDQRALEKSRTALPAERESTSIPAEPSTTAPTNTATVQPPAQKSSV